MPGKIKAVITAIIDQRAKGDAAIAKLTATKLILKGIDPDRFDASSPDDPVVLEKLASLAKDLGVAI